VNLNDTANTFLNATMVIWCSYVRIMVEARGIEPLSENYLPKLSTSVSNYSYFPNSIANWKSMKFGSLKFMTKCKAKLDSRTPLIDVYI